MSAIARAVLPRVWQRIDKTDLNGCWLWAPPLAASGYGEISVNGTLQLAHRVAYEMFVGSIPPTLTIDHTCHNEDLTCAGGEACPHRACVNPLHLEAVPIEINVQRAWKRKESPTCRAATSGLLRTPAQPKAATAAAAHAIARANVPAT